MNLKKLVKVLSALFVCVFALTFVSALSIDDVDKPFVSDGAGITTVDDAVHNIWATVVIVVQILAIAAVVFAGLRYMFASADAKADIKRSMGILVVGAILVFASTTVIGFVVNATKQGIPTT